jgi:secondary thiamine-phosphate synthase enzyme
MKQQTLSIHTQGRGSYEITDKVEAVVSAAQVKTGLCHVFIQHTSASLMLCENADPTVRRDLDAFMARLVPDGDAIFRHTTEGEDDMPAHVRTVLTHSNITLPISNGHCGLGTWQGIYVWEHRTHPHQRKVTVTVQG